tara:strand:- start:412 stop:774 length:363 start_codon:yes stop_codon:yes gene_type:complete
MIRDILLLCLVSIIYIFVLFFIAPLVDHAFTPLHKDETNLEIFFEIILQILTVATIWFILNKYINEFINHFVKIKKMRSIELSLSIVSGLMFVGLQTHLKSKLHYISIEHPFRIIRIFND